MPPPGVENKGSCLHVWLSEVRTRSSLVGGFLSQLRLRSRVLKAVEYKYRWLLGCGAGRSLLACQRYLPPPSSGCRLPETSEFRFAVKQVQHSGHRILLESDHLRKVDWGERTIWNGFYGLWVLKVKDWLRMGSRWGGADLLNMVMKFCPRWSSG